VIPNVEMTCAGGLWGKWWWTRRRWWRLVAGTAEKGKENNGRKTGREADFSPTLDPNFLILSPWNPSLFIGVARAQSFFHLGKNFDPWFIWERFQPLAQSRHHELLNLTVEGFLSWPL
jgi:hypothetical protein